MKINMKANLKTVDRKKALKIGGIAGGVLALSVLVFVLLNTFFGNQNSKEKVYVDSVRTLVNLGDVSGASNRYAGIVEPQDTWNIQKNSDRKIKEIFVKEGQSVDKGTKLFAYDVEDTQMNLEQARLEVERIQNDIQSMGNQIKTLQQESARANPDDRLDFDIQIQSTQASIKKSEFELRSKSAEVTKLEKSIGDSVVESKMKGVVQKINEDTESGESVDSSDSNVLMSILATGEYRVKGTITEQNIYTIEAGAKVIVRSRTDDKAMWKGTLQAVDTEKPSGTDKSEEQDMSMAGGNAGSQSSTYPFYVQLDSSDGLILGQHVYIEPDIGQAEQKEGLWLPSYYFGTEGSQRFVWIAGERELLQKRNVTVGEYDDSQDTYEIISGLTEEDYIAFPSENLKVGMGTTKNPDEATVDAEDIGADSGEDLGEEQPLEDEILDEGNLEENVDGEMMDGEILDGDVVDDAELETGVEGEQVDGEDATPLEEDAADEELETDDESQTVEEIEGSESDNNAPAEQ